MSQFIRSLVTFHTQSHSHSIKLITKEHMIICNNTHNILNLDSIDSKHVKLSSSLILDRGKRHYPLM